MKSQPKFIHLKLFDMWAREYQVLKNRTHPLMYMSSHSGYILTAIKLK
jgi:tRNA (adenine-N(1)-)-methyltransferase non-catalytic subunit